MDIESRTIDDIVEHRHDGYTYWHPIQRIHASNGEGKLNDLDEPSIQISEIEEINIEEAKIELLRNANINRKGSNPNDSWGLVNIKTGEFFFANNGLLIGKKTAKEWRKIGWND